ncbi:hypothetical protein [Sinorhizobium meliloti]|uniref:hypothetical protein n=1 Tax=Rhizobium meliloti TaxID=382 RepID=UPI001297478C|nr:hypothetical protein [Sinorhizobium meliloti]MQV05909.1 hypothetical protein [Sinorhizobium meliloti]
MTVNKRRASRGLELTRRTFVAGIGIATVAPVHTAWSEELPAKFMKIAANFIFRRGDVDLWTIDPRWFDFSAGGRIVIDHGGSRLKINGFIAGSNIALNLTIIVSGDTLSFSSFGNAATLLLIADLLKFGVDIDLRADGSSHSSPIVLRRSTSQFSARLTVPFNLSSDAVFSFSGRGIDAGTAVGLSVRVATKWDEAEPEIAQLLPGSRPLSRLILDRVTLNDQKAGWRLGSVAGRVLRLFFAAGDGKLSLDQVAAPAQKWIWRRVGSSSGKDGVRIRYGEQDFGRDIQVAGIEMFNVLDGNSRQHGLKISRSSTPGYIESERYAAAVKIAQDCFFPAFSGQSKIEFPIELFVLHARGTDQTRFDVDFRGVATNDTGLAIGAPGLNRSATVWDTEGTRGVAGVLSVGERAGEPSGTWLHLGEDDAAHVLLHRPAASSITQSSPILRLRRSVDGLDLGLLFLNFVLIVDETPRLVGLEGAQRGVRFNPQHLAEECFADRPQPEKPESSYSALWRPGQFAAFSRLRYLAYLPPNQTGLFAALSAWLSSSTSLDPSLRPLGSSDASDWFPGGPPTMIARTQASGDSRIIFKPKPTAALPLTAEALTNWSALELSVPERAVGEISIEDQLKLVGIEKKTSRDDAKTRVSNTLTQPAPDQTSLELVTGLFFCPEATARFRTTTPSSDRPALWTAQLDLEPPSRREGDGASDLPPSSVVRAVWAAGLDPQFLFGQSSFTLEPDPFVTSTSPLDRIEIALQSSAFGLVALRSVTKQGVDVPNSRVRYVPPGEKGWLFVDPKEEPIPDDQTSKDAPAGQTVVQEGVFSPAPFKSFTARLTGFGAELDAEWQAEPILPYTTGAYGKFFNAGFKTERYVHRTRLGSDSIAQVVYKGFLFPYGFRVSLVKISQREPAVMPEFGAMMPLITRYFIVPKPVTKTYPGIYQPFEARAIPARSARLLGERSPELDSSTMGPPDGLILPSIPGQGRNERIFWPMLPSGDRLKFDFLADGLDTRRTLPMLFVSNVDVGHPESMREIIRYYNDLGPELRTEDHHRGMTVYAPPRSVQPSGQQVNNSGSTSFETDTILLEARPRSLKQAVDPNADAPYSVDAFMNGVDEPPFYPLMVEAQVVVPPLDRILGAPQGLKRVAYNRTYLQAGFDQTTNKAELYLDFVEAEIMSLGGNARLSGSLAQPRNFIAGVSRINDIVGAQPATTLNARSTQKDMDLPKLAGAEWDFDSIQAGFDPRDFFKDAKLLGIVDLSEVVQAAGIENQPQLKQIFDYALGDNEASEALSEACKLAAGLIRTALADADRRLKALFASAVEDGDTIDPDDVSVEKFYPDLSHQLNAFADLLEKEHEGPALLPWVNAVVAQWGPVKSSIDAVIANPSPEPLRAGMAKMRALMDTLQQAFGKGLGGIVDAAKKAFIETAVNALITQVVALCFDANGNLVAPWFYEAITGQVPAADATPGTLARQLHALFDDPKTSIPQVANAMLGNVLTQPILIVLDQAQTLVDRLSSDVSIAVADAVRLAASLLQRATEALVELDTLIDATRQNASGVCSALGSAFHLEEFSRLILEFSPADSVFDTAITDIRGAWPVLDLLDLPDSAPVNAARLASANLRQSITSLQVAFHAFSTVKTSVAQLDLDGLCHTQPQQIVVLTARMIEARKPVFATFQVCVTAARELATAYAVLPGAGVAAAQGELKELGGELIRLAADLTCARLADIAQRLGWLDIVPIIGVRIRDLKSDTVAAAANLSAMAKAATAPTEEELAAAIQLANDLSRLEGALISRAEDFIAVGNDLVASVEQLRDIVLQQIAQPIIDLHDEALSLTQAAIDVFDQAPDLVKLFTQKVYERLKAARTALTTDRDALAKLTTDPGSGDVAGLLGRWRQGNFGLVNAANLVIEFFTAIMTGQIGGIFDLAAVRRAAEDAVRRLIPTKINTSYTLDAGLKKYKVFEPLGQKKISLTTHISIDLLNPADRDLKVTGEIEPFALHLLETPEFVTISFAKTSFHFDGVVPKFDTKIAEVLPGKALGFFDNLKEALDIDANVYAQPTLEREGLRVGYRYSKDRLDLGGIQVLNFGFDASMDLYFDGSAAVATVKVAERSAPCGIVVAPAYYGAGFISLSATASHVKAFEIQLEFGFARDMTFGPLHGFASVSAGIYLMSSESNTGPRTRVEGFVHAVGEGSIACFGVAVNFEVKVVHDNEHSDVTGSATYRFSFRIGLVSVGYGVTAEYKFKSDSSFAPAIGLQAAPATTCSVLPDKTKDWLCYRDHFVLDWPEDD